MLIGYENVFSVARLLIDEVSSSSACPLNRQRFQEQTEKSRAVDLLFQLLTIIANYLFTISPVVKRNLDILTMCWVDLPEFTLLIGKHFGNNDIGELLYTDVVVGDRLIE